MLKKFIMITIYLVIGYQAKGAFDIDTFINQQLVDRSPASDRSTSAVAKKTSNKMKNICTIQAGDIGKLRYKGKTYEQAFSKVTDECFQRRTQLYVKMRKQHPDQDRQIQFAESCVNSIKCI